MNHRQKEIDHNLELIADSMKGIDDAKQQIQNQRDRIKVFELYIKSRIDSNRQLKKHQMHDDDFRIYCLECGKTKEELEKEGILIGV